MSINDIKNQKIKCVVWDLDNTIWEGTILEDKNVSLKKGISNIIKTIDERGILQSIASKNDYEMAMKKLKEFKLDEYFIYPEIGWSTKSLSVEIIAKSINISTDTIAFIDDQEFEREEVKFKHPEILCIDSMNINSLLEMPKLMPKFITEDSKLRRSMYINDIKRKTAEEKFEGAQEAFLASLDMVLSIKQVEDGDLQRVEELTVRTHQLNTTGYTYSYDELDTLRKSENHLLFISSLDDKFGTYGKIGVTLIECEDNIWTIKLLLMSCRVMSRGVGSVMINYIMRLAKKEGVKLRAEFVPNDINRMMYITYKFAGFREVIDEGNFKVLECDVTSLQSFPDYLKVNIS